MHGLAIRPSFLSDDDPLCSLLNKEDVVETLFRDPLVVASIDKHLVDLHPKIDDFQPDDVDGELPPLLRRASNTYSSSSSDDDDDDLPRRPLARKRRSVKTHALSSMAITDEERNIGHFTRRKLKKLATWHGPNGWAAAEHKQLDQFHTIDMYGKPMSLTEALQVAQAVIVRAHYAYRIKANGTRRARLCCDGSPRAAPALHQAVDSFSSSLEHPVWRLFVAIATAMLLTIFGGDVIDAFAHSPGPSRPTFMKLDDAFIEWYFARFGVRLSRDMVVPVLRALQGHPEAGRLWEEYINGILFDLGFTTTTHDKNILRLDHEGTIVLLARQVDDLALACKTEAIARAVLQKIGERIKLPKETAIPVTFEGVMSSFNGYDVLQTRDYNKLSAESYLTRVLKSHGWDTPAKNESSANPKSPMCDREAKELYASPMGPSEGTPEHAALAAQFGFGYRSVLGELLYAYVLCRADIGYAVTTLARFSLCPNVTHYAALKKLAVYLRRTIDWGIYYWRPAPLDDLPHVPFELVTADPSLPVVPQSASYLEPVFYVDAAFGNIPTTMGSTTGYGATMCGGLVVYRCMAQPISAQNACEAELVAANAAAKVAKYLRMLLIELGFDLPQPTSVYEDNDATIKIVNTNRPTPRSRHIAIRYFGLQQWRELGEIALHHIAGIINPADALTKALGWVLHSRHVRFMMGHYGFRPGQGITSS